MPDLTLLRLVLVLIFVLTAAASALQAPAARIPPGREPTLDGVMGAEEWRDAATLARDGEATLFGKRAGDTLFLGLRGAGAGITTVGLLPEGGSRLCVLHASASLGTAEYERQGDAWTAVRPFAWSSKSPPGTAEGNAERAAFREAEGWLGTLASMGADSEIAIDLGAGRDGRLRCAVGHLGGSPVRIPAGSQDGLFGMTLQMGTAPETLAADPSQWLELVCSDAAAEGAPPLEGLTCVTAGSTWIYAADSEEAQALSVDAAAAAQDFERHFGRAPEPGAVVALFGRMLPAGVDGRLRAAGARWVLPWISSRPQPGVEDSLRAQIEGQLRAQLEPLGMSDAQITAQLEQVLAQLAGTSAGGLGLLRHELGHLWFISGFWGDEALVRPSDGAGHYAGPAADWLDETAAILLESPEATAKRRESIAAWLAAHTGPDRMRPLDELFRMPHPVDTSAILESLPPEARQGGSVTVLVQGGDSGAVPDASAERRFYEQCRLLADYLLATGGEGVFAALAASAARGESMESWLASEGAALGLPASVAALQADWLAWIDAQYPVAGADATPSTDTPGGGN